MRRGVMWVVLGLALIAGWAAGPGDAIAAISGSDHDFTGKGTDQLCLTCHTPHFGASTRLLWNHQLSSASFSWEDTTTTTGGTALPTNIKTWSGSTKNCLSCHDGTVAVGTLYHDGYTYTGSAPPKITATTVSGQNLQGTHPVAIPYPYGGLKNSYNQSTTGDLALLSGWNSIPVDVKLFTDPNFSAPSNRGLECASCHDPHGTPNPDFLRAPLAGSAICLRCHVK